MCYEILTPDHSQRGPMEQIIHDPENGFSEPMVRDIRRRYYQNVWGQFAQAGRGSKMSYCVELTIVSTKMLILMDANFVEFKPKYLV